MATSSLLSSHLEQIALCSASIAELPFPPPKIFTNALLNAHDITALIRDTEVHERALFSVAPPPSSRPQSELDPSRRATAFAASLNGASSYGGASNASSAVRAPRRNTAVAAVLGGDLVERIRRGGGGGVGTGIGVGTGFGYREGRERGEVDVDVLLEGAEKLCGVYPIPGAMEKIAAMRQRHRGLVASISRYEARVAENAAQLNRLNRSRDYDDDDEDEVEEAQQDYPELADEAEAEVPMTEEDLKKEEEEIRELEKKRHGLEERVNALSKDITGVLG